jgi:transposase
VISIAFTEEEIDILEYNRYNYPDPRVQKKMEVLYLKSQYLAHNLICTLCRISSVTLVDYLRQYQSGGIDRLKLNLHRGKENELKKYKDSLEDILRENPPQSTKEAAEIIKNQTGIERGLTQVRAFLKSLGFEYRKTAAVPKRLLDDGYAEKQDEFKNKELVPRIDEAKTGARDLFFWMPPILSTEHF